MEKHAGHENMHLEMVIILIVTLVVSQIALVQWKNRHPKSYNVSGYVVKSRMMSCNCKFCFF